MTDETDFVIGCRDGDHNLTVLAGPYPSLGMAAADKRAVEGAFRDEYPQWDHEVVLIIRVVKGRVSPDQALFDAQRVADLHTKGGDFHG